MATGGSLGNPALIASCGKCVTCVDCGDFITGSLQNVQENIIVGRGGCGICGCVDAGILLGN